MAKIVLCMSLDGFIAALISSGDFEHGDPVQSNGIRSIL
jgi:hypothetical protein